MIAGHLRGRGLAISPATVGRVLAEAKVRPHKVRGWLNRTDDPSFWLQAGAVCRLYLNPPPGTVLISVDEKTGIQAKSRKHPQVPARPGRGARREFEYVRHGTICIIAAMNVTTGQAGHRIAARLALAGHGLRLLHIRDRTRSRQRQCALDRADHPDLSAPSPVRA